jgi:hypothetical protein
VQERMFSSKEQKTHLSSQDQEMIKFARAVSADFCLSLILKNTKHL